MFSKGTPDLQTAARSACSTALRPERLTPADGRSLKSAELFAAADDRRRAQLQLPEMQQPPLLHVPPRGRGRRDDPKRELPGMPHGVGREPRDPAQVKQALWSLAGSRGS